MMVSGTIETLGTMLAGQTADAFCASVLHADLLSLGLNCGTGPEFMTDHFAPSATWRRFASPATPTRACRTKKASTWRRPLPSPRSSNGFLANGWLNIVGGCCGTTDAHIRAIAQMAAGKRPRPIPGRSHRAYYSGIELVEAEESVRPLIVGERTNVIGSRLFKTWWPRKSGKKPVRSPAAR